MKFDYDFIERIGATHYAENVTFYKRVQQGWVQCSQFRERNELWSPCWTDVESEVQSIPPRRQPEYKYELVTDKDFWELRDEFEGHQLFLRDGTLTKTITTILELSRLYTDNAIYRRVTVERDWRDEILATIKDGIVRKEGEDSIFVNGTLDRDNAIMFTKAILKATGESL